MARRRRSAGLSRLRRHRIRRVASLRAQGLSSKQIGQRLGIAPTTVRDYWNDPLRRLARKRQAKWAVVGPPGVEWTKENWKRGGPHKGTSMQAARTRGKQLRTIVGYRVRGG